MENNFKIWPKAVVCEESTFQGDVTVMPGCVIHTNATIIAEAGPIVLGENCIVEEFATIKFSRKPDDTPTKSASSVLNIGPGNIFEVGCTVEACAIGSRNIFECKCFVGPEVTVTNGCVVGAAVRLNLKQTLTENTIVYKNAINQRDALDRHTTQALQIEFLRKIIPNYHHLRRPNVDIKTAPRTSTS